MSPRIAGLRALGPAAVGVASILLIAVITDVVRLGPSDVVLTADSLTIEASWYRFPDDDPWDFYAVLVRLVSHVVEPSVYPYVALINITVVGGVCVDGFHPTAGDHAGQELVTVEHGGSPPTLVLNLPAGHIERFDGGSYMRWDVTGSHGLGSQPVFTKSADFYAEFRVPEGAVLEAHLDARVDWYYVNPLQAYPVATQGAGAVGYYPPRPGSEDSGPYGACE